MERWEVLLFGVLVPEDDVGVEVWGGLFSIARRACGYVWLMSFVWRFRLCREGERIIMTVVKLSGMYCV